MAFVPAAVPPVPTAVPAPQPPTLKSPPPPTGDGDLYGGAGSAAAGAPNGESGNPPLSDPNTPPVLVSLFIGAKSSGAAGVVDGFLGVLRILVFLGPMGPFLSPMFAFARRELRFSKLVVEE